MDSDLLLRKGLNNLLIYGRFSRGYNLFSTKDSFYSDDWKEVLVRESEYYTNDILLRSPTLQPYYSYTILYFIRDILVLYSYLFLFLSFTGLDKREVRERDRQGTRQRWTTLFSTTFFRFLLVENDFLVQKSWLPVFLRYFSMNAPF